MDIKRRATKEAKGGCNYANPNSKLNHILSNETTFEGQLLQGFALGDAQKRNGKREPVPCRVTSHRSCTVTRGGCFRRDRLQHRVPCRPEVYRSGRTARQTAAGEQRTKR